LKLKENDFKRCKVILRCLIALAFLLLVFNFSMKLSLAQSNLYSNDVGYFSLKLSNYTYYENQVIRINICKRSDCGSISSLKLSEDFELKIVSGNSTKTFVGTLEFPIDFLAEHEGVYTVSLISKSLNKVLSQTEFRVIKESYEQIPKEPIADAINLRELGEHLEKIKLSKEEFYLGEEVKINFEALNENLMGSYELLITHNEKNYAFVGELDNVEFYPTLLGNYSIYLKLQNEILDYRGFLVLDSSKKIPDLYDNLSLEINEISSVSIVNPIDLVSIPLASVPFTLRNRFSEKKQGIGRLVQTARGIEHEILNPIPSVNSIRFYQLKDTSSMLGIEEVAQTHKIYGMPSVKSYAIDPTEMDFTTASVRSIAKGTMLYVCKEYNFTTGECFGYWQKVRDIVPGEEYSFSITPEDPLYSEVNASYDCSCADSVVKQNSGTLSCSVYCAHTINIPANATSYYLQAMRFGVTLTVTTDGCTMTNARQNGLYDHDTTISNSNQATIGSGTSTSSTTFNWANTSMLSSGDTSFTNFDCSSWPDYCIYYTYLNASMNFQAPGKSKKSPSLNISFNYVNYTLNYTIPGNLSVGLNNPTHNSYTKNFTILFSYTPIDLASSLVNCSLYTNHSSWSSKNSTTSPVNGSVNTLGATFSSEGVYVWNVECYNSNGDNEFAPLNYTLTIDNSSPIVTPIDPANLTTITSSNVVTFTYNVTDSSPIDYCTLYLNGTAVKNSTPITKDQNQTIAYNVPNGVHDWSIGCYDNATNFGIGANRTINISVEKPIYDGEWYETGSSDCSSLPCDISVAQQTDGVQNEITGTLSSGTTVNILKATSDYVGANGGMINASTTTLFSTYFVDVESNLFARWYLYILDENDQTTLICSNTTGVGTSDATASVGSCTNSSNIRVQSTDRFYYEIEMYNTHPAQSKDFEHAIDHASSFFNLTGFTQVGFLSSQLIYPESELSLNQGDSFNLTCNVTCEEGGCINTSVYAQSNATGSWVNIGSSGMLTLNGSEVNPHELGTVFNETQSTSISINASSYGTADVRCYAESYYQSHTTDSIRINVASTEFPTVNLSYPGNDTWVNFTDALLVYLPSSSNGYVNCSLYINGEFNQSNSSAILNNLNNNFTITNIPEERFNWSVSCEDESGRVGNSSVFYFDVDKYAPYNIELNEPEPNFSTTNPYVLFNWTAYDLRSENMSCKLYINGAINETINSTNATATNVTVYGFEIGNYSWYVNCSDLANNFNVSETRNITVSDQSPLVNLLNPGNYNGVNSTTVTLTYNAYDNFALTECQLFINGVYNQSNQTGLINGLNNFTSDFEETGYNWSVTCFDDGGNNASTANWTFYVDITPPLIELHEPEPSANLTNSTILFSYTVTDNYDNLSCTLYFDGLENITANATSGIRQNVTGYGYSDGEHDWYVNCTDVGGYSNSSEIRNLSLNETPRLILNLPEDGTHIKDTDIILYYTATDNDGFLACDLFINGVFNQTNSTEINSGEMANFTLTNPPEGYYNWSVNCTDAGTYSNTNTTGNRSFVVDRGDPLVGLIAPSEAEVVNTTDYVFQWMANDTFSNITYCNLTINGNVNNTSIVSYNNTITNYTVEGLRTGAYNWSVACIDNATNTGYSVLGNFSVLLPPHIELVSPANNTGNLLNDVTFQYIPSLGSETFTRCTLILNGADYTYNDSIVPNVVNNFSVNLPEGEYIWNVRCNDTNSLTGTAEQDWVYYIDLHEPYNISLISPEQDEIVSVNNVSFTFVTEDMISPTLSCTVYLNESGSVYSIGSGLSAENGTPYTHYYLLYDGNYSWYVECVDKAGNYNTSVELDFEVFAPPNVTFLSPENLSWHNQSDIDFIYIPEDDFQIVNCTINVWGTSANYTDNTTTVLNKQNNTFSFTGMEQGEYNWTVVCYDGDGNPSNPSNATIYLDWQKPQITLSNPDEEDSLSSSSVLFNWTVTDNLAENLYCNLTINGTQNLTNVLVNESEAYTKLISGFNDSFYIWNVSCIDPANNSNYSDTRNFTVQEPPTVNLGNPINNYRNNTAEVILYFTPRDNSGEISSCTLILNGEENHTINSINSGQQNNYTLTNLENNTYTWDFNCSDPSSNTAVNGTPKTFHVDLLGPYIELISPEVNQTFNYNNITFKWNATDFNSSVLINCDLFVTDPLGDILVENINNYSGNNFSNLVAELSDGEHFWNVTCVDDLGNTNYSDTKRFVINQPDLYIESQNITFNNTNPDLLETITIIANVSNIGGIDAINAVASFWDGDPNDGGILIGNDTQNVSYDSFSQFSVEWSISEGYHTIYVILDPDELINELNETNNNATANISVLRVEVSYPENNSIFNYQPTEFNFTLEDYTLQTLNYTFFVNGSPIGVTGNVNDGESNLLNVTLNEGHNIVVIQAKDDLSRLKNSSPLNITIDLTAPIPYIHTMNLSWFNYSEPEINISATDLLSSIINYTIYVNGTPDDSGNLTNGISKNITLSSYPDGLYEIILEVIDDANNKRNSSITHIYIDTKKPFIELNFPENISNYSSRSISLNYTVTDLMSPNASCSIYLGPNDGSGVDYGPYVVNTSQEKSFLAQDLVEGEYYWNVSCFDLAQNYNYSETRMFNIYFAPNISLVSPPNSSWSNNSTNVFYYNVSDETGMENCSIWLNGGMYDYDLNVENNELNNFTVLGMNGTYDWHIECYDNTSFNAHNVSEEWTFYVDIDNPFGNITTQNLSWFKTNPTIDFVIIDNMALNINYTFFLNNSPNATGVVSNNTPSQTQITLVADGEYSLILQSNDSAGNMHNSSEIIFYHDSVAPQIILHAPENGNPIEGTQTELNFTVTDNMADTLYCNVTFDTEIIELNMSVDEGVLQNISVDSLSAGYHYWNVSCIDLAGNYNVSETWSFFVPMPDIYVNPSEIYFSDENPKENDLVTINATIRNIGNSTAENFIVQIWKNQVGVLGNQIGSNFTISLAPSESQNISVNLSAPLGTTEIIVIADPDNLIQEENETNNNASRFLSVVFWHYVMGNTNDTLKMQDGYEGILFEWFVENSTGSNIYVADYDSDISWTTLQALGRDTSNQSSPNDFEALDSALGSSNYGDSINNTFTLGGVPIETRNMTIFYKTIENVPVVNSTNNSNFKTGILWDYGDGNTNFNQSQDVLFVTTINKGAQGYNDTYDFEIRIPASLRSYLGPNSEYVVFYTEII